MKKYFFLVCIWSLAEVTAFAAGKQALFLNGGQREYPLGMLVEYLPDPGGKLPFAEVRSAKNDASFVRNTVPVFNKGFTDIPYWLRFTVRNESAPNREWYLEIGYSHLDFIDAYIQQPDGSWRLVRSGDCRAFDTREVNHRNFIFVVSLPKGSTSTVYLRVRTSSSFQVPLTLWEPAAFAGKVNVEQYGFGIYYGIIIAMIVYNLFLFLGIRDKIYALYALFNVSFLFGQMGLNGLAYQYLWRSYPWWANKSVVFFLYMSFLTASLFARAYLDSKRNVPVADKAILVYCGLSVIGMIASFIVPYAYCVRGVALLGATFLIPLLGGGAVTWKRGYAEARFFIYAWLALLVGVMLLALRNFGLLPSMFLTDYGNQIGCAMAVMLLSLGLADKINTMRRDKLRAQKEALAAQEKIVQQLREMDRLKDEMNRELECKVQQRTEELQKARDELWGEMELAKKIQTALLPELPTIDGYEIAAYMAPAAEIGGDYYDIINVNGLDWVIIGDVSGHGVSAGLVMMMVKISIQTVLERSPNIKPHHLLRHVNKVITENIRKLREDKYMTITAIACVRKGMLYFSGLHQDIMVWRHKTGKVDLVNTDGLWLGIPGYPRSDKDDYQLQLGNGDTMLLFTDGITEAWKLDPATNSRKEPAEMFGNTRLEMILGENGAKSPDAIKEAILDALDGYLCRDDVTLVIMKRGAVSRS